MPAPGKQWWHLILSTRGSWLPGDPRGFRSRGHRIHSSGDYKHRPPAQEHAGLHWYQTTRASDVVQLPTPLRPRIGQAVLVKLDAMEARVLVVAVNGMHAHLLAELDADYEQAKCIVGRLKQRASHAVRDELPGQIWAGGSKPVLIRDRAHLTEAYNYILRHAEQGAWVWTFKDEGGDAGEGEG